ncbi:MAG: Amuc_1099 family pilus-like system protein [Verrucomicrobiae bacterium]
MDWIKTNYERALLGLSTLVLVACAGWLAFQALSFPDTFSGRNSSKKPDNKISPPDSKVVDSASALAAAPGSWSPHEGSLLVSRPYVVKEGKLFDPVEGGEDLHPPIKNAWLMKYNLDYSAPDIKDQDPDNDRFSNLDEFQAGTDPTNPGSVPPYYTKLRLTKFDPVPFRLKFSGDSGDGETFIINASDAKSRTQFLKLGDVIAGTPYKVLGYEKKSENRKDMEVDISVLTVENSETGQKIPLIFNKEANDPTSYGEFLYLYDNSKIRVKKDDEFTLTPETARKYKLIDISSQEATIQDLSTGQKIRINKAD